jgi:hypothetical protein
MFHSDRYSQRGSFAAVVLDTGQGGENKRGTPEQWIKEGKQAAKITRLSCHHWLAPDAEWTRRLALQIWLQAGTN